MTHIRVPVAPGWYIVRKDGTVFSDKRFSSEKIAQFAIEMRFWHLRDELKVVQR